LRISDLRVRLGLPVSVLLFVSVLVNCSGGEKFEKRQIFIDGARGRVAVMAEVARSPEQRSQGLMYRKTLKDGFGMIFVFERDEILAFWMKNTLIPLSIAYIAYDGRILEIFDMQAESLNTVQSSRSARYALEVPQGWFNRAGIAIGDRLDLSGLMD